MNNITRFTFVSDLNITDKDYYEKQAKIVKFAEELKAKLIIECEPNTGEPFDPNEAFDAHHKGEGTRPLDKHKPKPLEFGGQDRPDH